MARVGPTRRPNLGATGVRRHVIIRVDVGTHQYSTVRNDHLLFIDGGPSLFTSPPIFGQRESRSTLRNPPGRQRPRAPREDAVWRSARSLCWCSPRPVDGSLRRLRHS
jgi:hypothetical protein